MYPLHIQCERECAFLVCSCVCVYICTRAAPHTLALSVWAPRVYTSVYICVYLFARTQRTGYNIESMAAHPPLSVIFIARGFRAHNRLASVGRRRRRTGRYKYICCYRVSVCNNLWTVPADRTHTKKETRHTGMNDINDGVCAPKCLFSRALTFDGTPAAKANGHAVSHGSVAPPPVVADISALDVNALRRAMTP